MKGHASFEDLTPEDQAAAVAYWRDQSVKLDAAHPLIRWIVNHADRPEEVNKIVRGSSVTPIRQGGRWVAIIRLSTLTYLHIEMDPRAPMPPR